MKTNYVDAVFGGAQVRFSIDREDLPALEATAGAPAFAMLQKFISGTWSVGELKAVLTFGALTDGQRRYLRRAGGSIPVAAAKLARPDDQTDVERVLASNPPAPYAVLAMRILEASLFGIEAEQAVFDEKAVEQADG